MVRQANDLRYSQLVDDEYGGDTYSLDTGSPPRQFVESAEEVTIAPDTADHVHEVAGKLTTDEVTCRDPHCPTLPD
ncbi:MAG: hypothetical protein RIR49_2172 [Actinomycetota bacterium]